MFRLRCAAALAVAVTLAGCTPVSYKQKPAPLKGACAEASGEATMSDPAAARYHARRTLERSLGPARDYLASEGLRRLRIATARVDCAPYALTPGRGTLTRCVASTHVCAK
jgi:hypothetical protein